MKEILPYPGGTSIGLSVQPRASRVELTLFDDRLRVRLTAPAEGGKANKQLLSVLSKALGVAQSRLDLVAGSASRTKRVIVPGLLPEEVEGRLLASMGRLF